MTNLNLVVAKMIEKKDLEGRYGWASCFDYPEQYDQISDLEIEIDDLLEGDDTMYKILDAVATDVMNGNVDAETLELSVYTQDEYLEYYVLEGMDEHAKNMFDSLYYFMDSDTRGKWLEANYLAHDPNVYTDRWMEKIVMLHC